MNKLILCFVLLVLSGIATASDIELTWDAPEFKDDGTAIGTIDRFNIYQTVNNGSTSIIKIDAGRSSFQLLKAEAGYYTFQISTVAGGAEGLLSDPVAVIVKRSVPIKIMLTVELIE